MDLFSFLSLHFICMTVTVVTGHSVGLSRRSHLFSMMSSLHDVLVHDTSICGGFRGRVALHDLRLAVLLRNGLLGKTSLS
jgi:hypothetical protein